MLDVKPFSKRERRYCEFMTRNIAGYAESFSEAAEIVNAMYMDGESVMKEWKTGGDAPVVALERLRVTDEELTAARREVSEQFLTALTLARVNARKFHENQRRRGYIHDDADGVRLIRQVRALRRVGICTGSSFSALLMHAVPAQLAGVGEIAVAVAPRADGNVDSRVLATAKILGIEEVYRMSGAHAVAALAFGGASLAPVDKIVGPGGPTAEAAKRLVGDKVGVDAGRGLGEMLVVADDSANARFIASDLLAQAEHCEGATLLALFTTDRLLAEAVRIEIDRLADSLPNSATVRETLEKYGAIYVFPNLGTAIDAANALAPARMTVMTKDNDFWVSEVETAGAVFVGPWAAEAVYDCFAGINPFLPLYGGSRYSSGLGVEDFIREISVVEYGPDRLLKTGRHLAILAEEEGLTAHAEAVKERLELLKLTVD